MVDTLKTVGLEPAGMIGHSVGEIGCGYADGCLTAREAIITAYWRGECLLRKKLKPGSMAAVGK